MEEIFLRVLVTGGNGFIGSHLVEALLHNGVEVRCLLRKTSDQKWLKGLPIEVIYGDCRDKNSLEEVVKGVDQVFHLAGVTKAIHDKTYFEVNAQGTENLILACLENNPHIKKFVYLSSQAAAGPCLKGDKMRESDPCTPISVYGQSKRKGEELALSHASHLPILILRPCAVYGPRERDIYQFFKLLSKGIKLSLSGMEQRVSLCYVEDIIQAIQLASQSKQPSGEIFFLSDGQAYCLDEIGEIVAKVIGTNPYSIHLPEWTMKKMASFSEWISKISKKPSPLNRGKMEEILQKNWVCDITKAKTGLGFEPHISLEQGAKLTYEWYKKENWL